MSESTVEVTVSPGLLAPTPAQSSEQPLAESEPPRALPQDLLLIVFIHG